MTLVVIVKLEVILMVTVDEGILQALTGKTEEIQHQRKAKADMKKAPHAQRNLMRMIGIKNKKKADM